MTSKYCIILKKHVFQMHGDIFHRHKAETRAENWQSKPKKKYIKQGIPKSISFHAFKAQLSCRGKKNPCLRSLGLLITAVRFLLSPQAPSPFPLQQQLISH